MAKIRAGIFFDNAEVHINEVRTYLHNIESYKVDDSGKHIKVIGFTEEPFKSYVENNNLKDNIYYKLLQDWKVKDVAYDNRAGLNYSHIQILSDWIKATTGITRAAIFDWDRTLSVFEGIHYHSGPTYTIQYLFPEQDPKVAGNAMLEFACGGKDRLASLREMFAECYKNNVKIYILTNNGGCKTSNILKELLELLILPNPFKVICSIEPPSSGNKGLSLLQQDEFSELVVQKGVSLAAYGAAAGYGPPQYPVYPGYGAAAGFTRTLDPLTSPTYSTPGTPMQTYLYHNGSTTPTYGGYRRKSKTKSKHRKNRKVKKSRKQNRK